MMTGKFQPQRLHCPPGYQVIERYEKYEVVDDHRP